MLKAPVLSKCLSLFREQSIRREKKKLRVYRKRFVRTRKADRICGSSCRQSALSKRYCQTERACSRDHTLVEEKAFFFGNRLCSRRDVATDRSIGGRQVREYTKDPIAQHV